MISVIVALLVICWACSTPQTRAEGREMLKPYERAAWIFNAVVVGALVLGELAVKLTTGHY